eukprot:1836678-Rhodomonas_salina.1
MDDGEEAGDTETTQRHSHRHTHRRTDIQTMQTQPGADTEPADGWHGEHGAKEDTAEVPG